MVKLILVPEHPERICWGCEQHCNVAVDGMMCGKRSPRTPHPCEVFGLAWFDWAQDQSLGSSPVSNRSKTSATKRKDLS